MTSIEKVKQFNEIICSLLIQVSPFVGSTYANKFEQIIKYNSHLAIEQFLIHALPIRDKIINRDESYFCCRENLENSINSSEVIQTVLESNTNMVNDILKLKGIWEKITLESQSNVWDIIYAMLILGEEFLVLNKSKYIKI